MKDAAARPLISDIHATASTWIGCTKNSNEPIAAAQDDRTTCLNSIKIKSPLQVCINILAA
ncbi:MAG: hypothetical protein MJA31_17135 [Clostridia bacterium]|nr:hypothetical protein [Clostridia bacterium]